MCIYSSPFTRFTLSNALSPLPNAFSSLPKALKKTRLEKTRRVSLPPLYIFSQFQTQEWWVHLPYFIQTDVAALSLLLPYPLYSISSQLFAFFFFFVFSIHFFKIHDPLIPYCYSSTLKFSSLFLYSFRKIFVGLSASLMATSTLNNSSLFFFFFLNIKFLCSY